MVQVLNQKTGRQELRQVQVYQKAIEIMFEKSPLCPGLVITVKEAEEEMKRAERGIIPFSQTHDQQQSRLGEIFEKP